MNRVVTFASGAGLGAAAVYFLDPRQGRRRRKLAGDHALHATYVAPDSAEATRRDLSNRSRGIVARVRGRFRGGEADDRVIEERVRSRIGRVVSHPGAIEVGANDGRVTLSGPLLAHEADALLRTVDTTRGVRSVENNLSLHESGDDVPGLQGGAQRPGMRPDVMQQYWSPATRLFVGTAGAGLIALGVARRGFSGLLAGAAGTGLVARATTNMESRRLLGLRGRRGVDFHKTITVEAPVERLYSLWSQPENFPLFMEHVRQVNSSSNGNKRRWHWTVSGPAGAPVHFDTELSSVVDNKLVAWKSIGRSPIRHAGIVRFEPEGNGSRVDVQMTYNPPLGVVGHAVASILGANPKAALDEDLMRFKSLVEDGKTTVHGREVTQEEIVEQTR